MPHHEIQRHDESPTEVGMPNLNQALAQHVWDGIRSGIASGAGVAARVVMDGFSLFTLEAPNPQGERGAPIIQEGVRQAVADLVGIQKPER